MKNYDVIIIGAGPAGLFAAIQAAKKGRVLILEKMPSPGRKLLLSGSGQCNITHTGDVDDFITHYGQHGRFLKHALYSFSNSDLLAFFRLRGVVFETDNRGKYFPTDRKAISIINALQREAKKLGVEIKTESSVTKIEKAESFTVYTDSVKFIGKSVIIATGGKSWSQTGSSGDGQQLAKALGHTIVPMKPALTSISIKEHQLVTVAGNSFENISIILYRNGKKQKQFMGDMVITHAGYSGPVILDNSRDFAKGDLLKINFCGKDEEHFRNDLKQMLKESPSKDIKNCFAALVGLKNLATELLSAAGIQADKKCAEISKKEMHILVEAAIAFPVAISSIDGYDKAMVTAGGVSVKEINSKTMESKLLPRLYFAGEVLDIDGDTGGYNLQAAFSTGFIAGRAV